MTDLAFLTRDPEQGDNNWVVATQTANPQTNSDWRFIAFGKGRGAIKGSSFAEVETDLFQYIANRVSNGYVEQVRLKVFFPVEKIVKFVVKHLPTILKFADSIGYKGNAT